MVIKGRIRGHGRSLASYLLTQGDNECVQVLDVDGNSDLSHQDLRELLGDFSLNEKLTRSRQGLYHCVINPPENESVKFSNEQWLGAVQILAEETGFADQRRAVVLHRKHGRVHAHVAFERYSHDTGKMIPIDHNYRKHDKARQRMEQAFNQKPTPKRNNRRDLVKQDLTEIWNATDSATTFIRQAKAKGYIVAAGSGRTPFAVVDETGRSYNLARQIEGYQTKDIRERFGKTVLMNEKAAIAFVRTQQSVTKPDDSSNEKQTYLNSLKQQREGQKLKGPKLS